MTRTLLIVLAALAAAGNAAAAIPKLTASVSDPLNISLRQGTKKVSHLKPGTYVIVVRDTASDHNFHLTGPGVNRSTSVSAKGTSRWTVKLKKGSYTFVCDPHASFMKGSFTVS